MFRLGISVYVCAHSVRIKCQSVLHYVPWPMDATSYQNKLDIFILEERTIRNRFRKNDTRNKQKQNDFIIILMTNVAKKSL